MTYYDQLIQSVEEQQKKYREAQQKLAAYQKQSVDAAYKNAEATIRKNIEAQATEADDALRQTLDYNAVNEEIARRNAREAMANAGISSSGLSETNQTAISVMRGNADAAARANRQKQVDALALALDQYLAENAAKQAQDIAKIDVNAAQAIADNEQKLLTAAQNNYNDYLTALTKANGGTSGGTTGGTGPVVTDTQDKLTQAKELLAAGLITQEEYNRIVSTVSGTPAAVPTTTTTPTTTTPPATPTTTQNTNDYRTPGTLAYAQNQVARAKRAANATDEKIIRTALNFADDLSLDDMMTLLDSTGLTKSETGRKKLIDAIELRILQEDVGKAETNFLFNVWRLLE